MLLRKLAWGVGGPFKEGEEEDGPRKMWVFA